jgi:hypothetical protein
MVRPVGHPLRRRAITIHELREEFLARCEARNLSDRTIQWYEDRTGQFEEWCASREIVSAGELTCSHLEDFLLALRQQERGAHTVRGFAQILKSLCRFGYRKGLVPEDITPDFEMPRVPKTLPVLIPHPSRISRRSQPPSLRSSLFAHGSKLVLDLPIQTLEQRHVVPRRVAPTRSREGSRRSRSNASGRQHRRLD